MSGHVKDDAHAAEKQLSGRYEKPPPEPATRAAAMLQNVAEVFRGLFDILANDSEMETSETIGKDLANDGMIKVPTEVLTILASDSETEKDQDKIERDIVRVLRDVNHSLAIIKNGAVAHRALLL